jgi:hypothetical protein
MKKKNESKIMEKKKKIVPLVTLEKSNVTNGGSIGDVGLPTLPMEVPLVTLDFSNVTNGTKFFFLLFCFIFVFFFFIFLPIINMHFITTIINKYYT